MYYKGEFMVLVLWFISVFQYLRLCMYYKGEFVVLHLGCYFYDNITSITSITSVFSLESTTSGCVCTTRGSLWFYTWAAISTITFLG